MAKKTANADIKHIRQTTQYSCCAASLTAALHACGKNLTEDDVNLVLGAAPMAGATWEAMLATVQYFGCRGTLVVPATPRMLKAWTDQGIPVLIAWNPESRPWSHASTVFDVTEDDSGNLTIHVMDPNIPNPSKTTRSLGEDEFCQKWGEKISDSLIVRRPAMAVEREITVEGRQVMAKKKPQPVAPPKKDPDHMEGDKLKNPRLGPGFTQMLNRPGAGAMTDKERAREKGIDRKQKHKKNWTEKDGASRVASRYLEAALKFLPPFSVGDEIELPPNYRVGDRLKTPQKGQYGVVTDVYPVFTTFGPEPYINGYEIEVHDEHYEDVVEYATISDHSWKRPTNSRNPDEMALTIIVKALKSAGIAGEFKRENSNRRNGRKLIAPLGKTVTRDQLEAALKHSSKITKKGSNYHIRIQTSATEDILFEITLLNYAVGLEMYLDSKVPHQN